MGATVFEVGNWESASFELFATPAYARGVAIQPERRCPHCNSIVYSRRHKLCGVCAEPLPNACVFSSEQSVRVATLVQEERQRHRNWLSKVNSK